MSLLCFVLTRRVVGGFFILSSYPMGETTTDQVRTLYEEATEMPWIRGKYYLSLTMVMGKKSGEVMIEHEMIFRGVLQN